MCGKATFAIVPSITYIKTANNVGTAEIQGLAGKYLFSSSSACATLFSISDINSSIKGKRK